MHTINFLKHKPKSAFACLLALAASSLLLIPPATAGEFILDVQGELTEPVSEEASEGTRTRRFETQIALDFGTTIMIGRNGQFISETPVLDQDGLWIKVKVEETEIINGKNAVSIDLSVIDSSKGQETVVAQPHLTALYDETAQFISEKDGKKYSFNFSPRSKP